MSKTLKMLAVFGFSLSTLAGTLVGATAAQAGSKGKLNVEIDGLKNQNGQVCLKLYSGSGGFPNGNQNVVQQRCVKLTQNPLTVTFSNVAAGSYAVAVIHDANGDNQVNRNALGIPTEGFGFSRNPVIRTGAPRFGEAAVVVVGPNTNIQIQMQYLFGG